MAELFLVRHGQASFDSEDYDELSDLGRQQSLWLGEYFAERAIQFDSVIIGDQRRHRQTAECMAQAMGMTHDWQYHSGLNEYDFDSLFAALGDQHTNLKTRRQYGRQAYYRALKQVLMLWQNDNLGGTPAETWREFYKRVGDTLQSIQQSSAQRVLAVSSGGPISTMVGMALKVEPEVGTQLNLQMYNSGLTHLFFNAVKVQLASFNYIPHLDLPGRINAISYG